MNSIDQIYQDILDSEVEKVSNYPANELKLFKDYDVILVKEKENIISVGWGKYKIDENTYHFVYKTSRKVFIFFHKPFLIGLKLTNNKIERMTPEELGNYD